MTSWPKMCLVILSPMLIQNIASANGLTPPVIGGNFASPVELNPSDVYWNAGALGQLRGTQIFLNVAPTFYSSTYNQGATYPTTVSSSLFAPTPILGISSDFGLKYLTVGFGVYPPFGGETHWPVEGPQKYQGSDTSISAFDLTPSVAWRILPNLSIGAGVSYEIDDMSATLSQDAYEYVKDNPVFATYTGCTTPEDPRCEVRVNLTNESGTSLGWNAGVYYRPIDDLDIGLSYVSQVDTSLNGDIRLLAVGGNPQLTAVLTPNGSQGRAAMAYVLPQFVNLGIRYRLTRGWILDVLGRWFDWRVHKQFSIDISGLKGLASNLNGPMAIPSGYRNAVSGRIGGIYDGIPGWRILGVVGYDQSGISNETMSATNLEFDKVYLAAAADYSFWRHYTVGAGYNHAFMIPRAITNSTLVPSANGTYAGNLDIVDVTLAYHF